MKRSLMGCGLVRRALANLWLALGESRARRRSCDLEKSIREAREPMARERSSWPNNSPLFPYPRKYF